VHPVEGLIALFPDDADQVNDRVRALGRALDRFGVEDVACPDEDRPVVAVARRIPAPRQDRDDVLSPEQLVDHVRPHESRASRDQKLQKVLLGVWLPI
jgi:hypothetical protein